MGNISKDAKDIRSGSLVERNGAWERDGDLIPTVVSFPSPCFITKMYYLFKRIRKAHNF